MGKARGRKRHIQTDLVFKRTKNGKPMPCGKKGRSGRKPKPGKRAGSPHTKRPTLKGRFPVHVVLRVHEDVKSLRKRFMYTAIRLATIAVAMRELEDAEGRAFRIVHMSIQKNHVHLLVEADNEKALARGLQSFQISAAKHINREVSIKLGLAKRRRGSVFPDRYHMEILTTPKQVRHTLAYVLNNWRKHKEDRGEVQSTWNVDPYSTGWHFMGWKEREHALVHWWPRETYVPLVVYIPRTWLLTYGWRKYGLISFNEVPSAQNLARSTKPMAKVMPRSTMARASTAMRASA